MAPPPDSLPPAPISHSGIPFGLFRLPPEVYGTEFNGGTRELPPDVLLAHLAATRQGGGRVILRFVGGEERYRNSDGSFSLAKWKQRLDRFREIDFASYIQDGTIAGHFILDEPHDPSNWGGTTVPPATIDEMARYSKQLWPSMPTIIRAPPAYLRGHKYKYLDAAWAQYSARFGPISNFMSSNIQDAKATGLALVVGLNLLNGGTKASGIRGLYQGKYAMGASQVRSWGSVLLSDPYVCAFINWRYSPTYLSRSDIKSALSDLSRKARSHPERTCRPS